MTLPVMIQGRWPFVPLRSLVSAMVSELVAIFSGPDDASSACMRP
jgi:hypothetical protein